MKNLPLLNRGFTLFQLVVVILLLGGGALAAFKIGKPYAEAKLMQGIVTRTLQETAKESNPSTEYDIAKKLFDRATVQSIPLAFEKISVKRQNFEDFQVHIEITTTIQLWTKASLVIDLEANGTTEGMPRN